MARFIARGAGGRDEIILSAVEHTGECAAERHRALPNLRSTPPAAKHDPVARTHYDLIPRDKNRMALILDTGLLPHRQSHCRRNELD